MGSLLNIPYGNGEENVVTMAMPLIATYYLDLTNQWDKVGLHEREVAVKYIQMGKPHNMDITLIRTAFGYTLLEFSTFFFIAQLLSSILCLAVCLIN